MEFLIAVISFLTAIAILVTVHEYGHFLVARGCGVKVLRFSVGFGKPIACWIRGPDRTEWVIGSFPIGGYVKMLDEREGPVSPRELHRSFNHQSLPRRSLIVAAGALANFLFAILVYWIIFLLGSTEPRPVIEIIDENSLAARAGLRNGDLVRAIDGSPIQTWRELRWQILIAGASRSSPKIEVAGADGVSRQLVLDLDSVRFAEERPDPVSQIGLRLDRKNVPAIIGGTEVGGAADSAGLKRGDRVVRIDNLAIDRWSDLVAIVRRNADRELIFDVERDGVGLLLKVVPQRVESNVPLGFVGRIGAFDINVIQIQQGPLEAVGTAVLRTGSTAAFSLRMLWRMITGDLSWRNLSGPVAIADYAGQSARVGFTPFLEFLALISISLGIFNLLPIPVLDGGHLMYYVLEAIKGGPLPEIVLDWGQRIGLVLIVLLAASALFNDLHRLLVD